VDEVAGEGAFGRQEGVSGHAGLSGGAHIVPVKSPHLHLGAVLMKWSVIEMGGLHVPGRGRSK